jgi:hypothetical protein
MEQWRQRAEVFAAHAPPPRRLAQHSLDHQRVDVDQRDLQQVRAQDRDLLVIEPVPRAPRAGLAGPGQAGDSREWQLMVASLPPGKQGTRTPSTR